jgi:hypothetical protein
LFFLAMLLPVHAEESPKQQVDAIIQSLKAGDVARIEVFGVPPDLLFRSDFAPERLETGWDYKLTIRNLDSTMKPRADALAVALRSAAIQPSRGHSLDVRRGVVLYPKTPEGKRLASLYFDRSGRIGGINSTVVSFGPEFLFQLKKALHAQIE